VETRQRKKTKHLCALRFFSLRLALPPFGQKSKCHKDLIFPTLLIFSLFLKNNKIKISVFEK